MTAFLQKNIIELTLGHFSKFKIQQAAKVPISDTIDTVYGVLRNALV